MATDTPPTVVLTAADARRLQLLAAGVFAPLRAPMSAAVAAAVRSAGELPDGTPWSAPIELLVEAPELATACVLKEGEGRTLGHAKLAADVAQDGLRRVLEMPTGIAVGEHVAAAVTQVGAAGAGRELVAYVVEECLHRADVEFLRTALPGDAALLVLRLTGCADEPCHLLHATGLANQRALAHLAHPHTAVFELPRFDLTRPAARPMLERIAGNLGAARTLWRPRDDSADGRLHGRVVRALIRGDKTSADALSWPDVAATLSAAHLPAGRRGFTVLLTGLSGAGKSTIARLLSGELMTRTLRPVSLLDGDLVRNHLSRGLGFGKADREVNLMRIAFVAREITRHGGIAICAPIAPYTAIRTRIRDWISEVGEFVEVHVATPIDVCEQRDPKGLYALARAGELRGFTGIDDPYEPPEHPELRLDTSRLALSESVDAICAHLLDQGLIQLADVAS